MSARPLFLLLCLAVAAAGILRARSQPDSNGFISIDCGLPGPASSVDGDTELPYSPDTGFTDAGSNHDVSVEYTYSRLWKLYYNVRSFPDGERNCYTLRSLVPGIKYLIRAFFMYGNYDGLNSLPIFDLYVGANFWTTVSITTLDRSKIVEAIVVVPDDFVRVCLVNTGAGTPFISALDLRPLKSELYPQVSATQGLVLDKRFNFGPTDPSRYVRYPQDSRDRIWVSAVNRTELDTISTSNKVQSSSDDLFEVPTAVMQRAVMPRKVTENKIEITWDSQPLPSDPSPGYFVVLHFAELRLLRNTALRQFYVRFNGELLYPEAYTPGYLISGALYNTVPVRSSEFIVSVEATSASTRPPLLNAMEVFTVMSTTKADIP